MGYNVKFGNYYLNKYCSVLNVDRSIMPPRENFSKQVMSKHGSYYTGFRYGERIITLDVALIKKNPVDYIEAVGVLANILNVLEPQEMIIGDEPYKVYYAIPDGSTNLSKFATTGRCSIQFICHDPMAYSIYWNSYSPYNNKTFKVTSYGNVETFPLIDVDFNNKACFFQLTNPKGETVLIGKPKSATKPVQNQTDIAVSDPMSTITNLTAISASLLDTDRLITGNHGIGFNGAGVVCTNYGTAQAGKWTGVGFKRAIPGSAIRDFEVVVDLTFSSKGENWVAPPPTPPPPPPPPTPAPPAKPPEPVQTPPPASLGTWKVVNCGGLYINAGPGTANPLYAMAPGTIIYPVQIDGKWMKHTHSNQWNTFTGWSSKNYLQKISDSGVAQQSLDINSVDVESLEEEMDVEPFAYADEQMGLLEVYGFDANGIKLFKFEIADTNEFYEYVDPKGYIGTSLAIEDGKNAPSPRKEDVKNSSGTVTGQESVASGVFGDFNDFVGKVTVRRETNSQGTQLWTMSIQKIVNGKVTNQIVTGNSFSNSSYPKGDLSYLGFYIGRYGTNEPTSELGFTNISVRKLNFKPDDTVSDNLTIFEKDDHLQINFETGEVSLNNKPILSQLDIGSEFFTIPPGNSQFAYVTDDTTASVTCGFKDKFI